MARWPEDMREDRLLGERIDVEGNEARLNGNAVKGLAISNNSRKRS